MVTDFFFIWTEKYGFEPMVYTTHSQAADKIRELLDLAAYKGTAFEVQHCTVDTLPVVCVGVYA